MQLKDLSTVDLLLDKDGDDLTEEHLTEHEMFHLAVVTCTKTIREVEESHHQEAERMVPPQQEGSNPKKNQPESTGNDNLTVTSSATKKKTTPFTWQTTTGDKNHPNLEKLCQKAYASDKIFKKILTHPKDHKSFEVKNGLIYHSANSETRRLCIPHSKFRGRKITKLVIDQVH